MDKNNIMKHEKIESMKMREPLGVAHIFLQTVALISSLYHFYFGFFPIPIALRHRPIHLMFMFILMFMIHPFSKEKMADAEKIPVYDWLFIVFTVLSTGYLIINADLVTMRMLFIAKISSLEYFYGFLLIVMILIASYRVIGKPLFIVTAFFLLYGYFGNYLPGFLWHKGYSIQKLIEYLYFSLDAIWTVPIHVTSTYVYLFILFGTFLKVGGTADFFIDLSRSITGKSVGGPAKTAVISSSLMGTVSGSSTANVVTTGSFTIPMMINTGYTPVFAGAVEAVASTGGQIVPPVMGAAAFMMAEIIGVPYLNIMKHAIIPAFLYYFSIFLIVHIESLKLNIKPYQDTVKLKGLILSKGYMFLPVFAIVYFLVQGYSPMRAAFGAIVVLMLIEFFKNKDKIEFFKLIIKVFIEAPKSLIPVTVACASAGIIVGVINLTGIGLRVTPIIYEVANNQLIIYLFLTMVLAIILGMGLPTSGAYIIMAVMLTPGLVKMGVDRIPAHFFVFYFACLSAVTPPVALAAYAGAGISGANSNQTGFLAFRLSLASFLVPYMFVYGPSLLLIGDDYFIIILSIITAIIGIVALACFVTNWLFGKINFFQRVLLFLVGILLIKPGILTDIPGMIIFSIIVCYRYIISKSHKENVLQ